MSPTQRGHGRNCPSLRSETGSQTSAPSGGETRSQSGSQTLAGEAAAGTPAAVPAKTSRPRTVADLSPEQQARIAPYLGASDGAEAVACPHLDVDERGFCLFCAEYIR